MNDLVKSSANIYWPKEICYFPVQMNDWDDIKRKADKMRGELFFIAIKDCLLFIAPLFLPLIWDLQNYIFMVIAIIFFVMAMLFLFSKTYVSDYVILDRLNTVDENGRKVIKEESNALPPDSGVPLPSNLIPEGSENDQQ